MGRLDWLHLSLISQLITCMCHSPNVHHHNSWLTHCRRTADPSGGNAAVCTWASQAALCAMLRHFPKCSAAASQNIVACACLSLLVHQLLMVWRRSNTNQNTKSPPHSPHTRRCLQSQESWQTFSQILHSCYQLANPANPGMTNLYRYIRIYYILPSSVFRYPKSF